MLKFFRVARKNQVSFPRYAESAVFCSCKLSILRNLFLPSIAHGMITLKATRRNGNLKTKLIAYIKMQWTLSAFCGKDKSHHLSTGPNNISNKFVDDHKLTPISTHNLAETIPPAPCHHPHFSKRRCASIIHPTLPVAGLGEAPFGINNHVDGQRQRPPRTNGLFHAPLPAEKPATHPGQSPYPDG